MLGTPVGPVAHVVRLGECSPQLVLLPALSCEDGTCSHCIFMLIFLADFLAGCIGITDGSNCYQCKSVFAWTCAPKTDWVRNLGTRRHVFTPIVCPNCTFIYMFLVFVLFLFQTRRWH